MSQGAGVEAGCGHLAPGVVERRERIGIGNYGHRVRNGPARKRNFPTLYTKRKRRDARAAGMNKEPRVMLRWLRGRGAGASAVSQVQARITPELWNRVLQAPPFLAALDRTEDGQLPARAARLPASKTQTGHAARREK